MTYIRLKDAVRHSLTFTVGKTSQEIADELGKTRSSVSSRLSELRKDGRALQDEDGRWYATRFESVWSEATTPRRRPPVLSALLLSSLVILAYCLGRFHGGL